MCGITGFVYPPAGHSWDPRDVLRGMVDSIAHRGPDDEGIEVDEAVGLFMGFRRLAILDLSAAGHQPMASASGRFVITFNGEIYNFQSLREELRGAGFGFKGGSDTEVMLAAFERWGCEEAVRRFRGMFAFALWDRREKRLWLARDRMGIKPLYLLRRDGGLAYASEARAFHRCPLYGGGGNTNAALGFLQRLHVSGPESILEGVERVAPGELLSFQLGVAGASEVGRTKYWDLGRVAEASGVEVIADEAEAVEGLLDLLRESIRLRLIADVPVGALLSGGVDSSLVVGIMMEVSSAPVRTFTISFNQAQFDEGPVARAVADHLGTQHTSVTFTTDDVRALIPHLAELSDEPMANPSLLPTLLISRVARRDVVVALSGDGGDELFGGYNRYLHGARLIRRLGRVPRLLRRGIAAAARGLASQPRLASAVGVLQPSSMADQQSPAERLVKLAGVLGAGGPAEAYERLLCVGMSEPPVSRRAERAEPPRTRLLGRGSLENQMMLDDQLHYLPDDLLAKVDRASMWESLEARVPILDQEIVKFAWRLPATLKIRRGVTKWPLRQLALRYVPASVLERPKMGFTVPIVGWLRGGLREWARDVLGPASVRDTGLLDARAVEHLWAEFDRGRAELAQPLWTAAVLHSWAAAWRVRF